MPPPASAGERREAQHRRNAMPPWFSTDRAGRRCRARLCHDQEFHRSRGVVEGIDETRMLGSFLKLEANSSSQGLRRLPERTDRGAAKVRCADTQGGEDQVLSRAAKGTPDCDPNRHALAPSDMENAEYGRLCSAPSLGNPGASRSLAICTTDGQSKRGCRYDCGGVSRHGDQDARLCSPAFLVRQHRRNDGGTAVASCGQSHSKRTGVVQPGRHGARREGTYILSTRCFGGIAPWTSLAG
jgi:hypothetical protein